MKGPGIAVLLGGKPSEDEEDHSSPDMGDEDFDDLDEKEIVEHKHAAAEEFLKAIEDRSAGKLLKAFEALHGLDHAAWDKEGKGEEPKDDGEEPKDDGDEPEDDGY